MELFDRQRQPRSYELIVEKEKAGKRLDRFIAAHPEIKVSRSRIQKLIESGDITVNGKTAINKYPVVIGDKITVNIPPKPISKLEPEDITLDVVFEDDYLAVINKPMGMLTHPGVGNFSGTLVNALLYHFNKLSKGGGVDRPGIVHRLDKNTTGLLVIAKDDEVHEALKKQIQSKTLKRIYNALICGHMKEEHGVIEAPIGRSMKNRKRMAVTNVGSREAVTDWRLLKRYRTYDLLEISLQTGRTHQIRVHFSHLGHPVFGDPDYGGRDKWHKGMFAPERPLTKELLVILTRQALHAKKIEFTHPVTQERMSFDSDLPPDFAGVLRLLDEEGN